ncbi:unnamed protein product [Orchesella dallaii]|uniref:Uncharacterized protein n=1 Tax=Orchesella dallaii TaxID=48710 RepID=A0ABP1PTN3_9HEXA
MSSFRKILRTVRKLGDCSTDILKDRNSSLQILDDNVQMELLNEATSTENDFTVKFLDVNRTQKIMDKEKQNANDEFGTASAQSFESISTKRKHKLRKLEFVQFEGNPKDWLSFWNQFQSIHEAEDTTG